MRCQKNNNRSLFLDILAVVGDTGHGCHKTASEGRIADQPADTNGNLIGIGCQSGAQQSHGRIATADALGSSGRDA